MTNEERDEYAATALRMREAGLLTLKPMAEEDAASYKNYFKPHPVTGKPTLLQRLWADRNRAAGLCRSCGKPSKGVFCREHQDQINSRDFDSRLARLVAGLCLVSGCNIHPSGRYCTKHKAQRQAAVARHKAKKLQQLKEVA